MLNQNECLEDEIVELLNRLCQKYIPNLLPVEDIDENYRGYSKNSMKSRRDMSQKNNVKYNRRVTEIKREISGRSR